MNSFAAKHSSQGHRSWRVFGSADPGRYVGVRSSFDPLNVAFFQSKLLLDYFNVSHRVGCRMKEVYQKWKGKLIFQRAWNSLMAWPDWPWPHIISRSRIFLLHVLPHFPFPHFTRILDLDNSRQEPEAISATCVFSPAPRILSTPERMV